LINKAGVPTRRVATALLMFGLLGAGAASAHHSWSSQDTRYAYYIAGEVTYVRWGNPHVEVHVRVDNNAPPADWLARPLPPGADERDGKDTMVSARAYRASIRSCT
jgi:hypothetical protein